MKNKKKESFLTKLLKFLLFLLALLVIFVFSAQYLLKWLHSGNEVYIKTTSKRPTGPEKTKAVQTKGAESERYHPRSLEQTANDISKYNTKPRTLQKVPQTVPQTLAEKYQVEPEATSAHLTQRIGSSEKDLGYIKAYLSQDVDPNQLIDNDSPAFMAARTWNLPVLKELGAIDFSATTGEGWTIMHIVCTEDPKEEEIQRAVDTIEYLLTAGGEIDVINTTNRYSPLMRTVELGNFEMACILLDFKASPDGPVSQGFEWNPLMLAVKHRQGRIFKFLTEKDASIISYNKDGISSLQYSVILGDISELDFILGILEIQGVNNAKNIQVPSPEDVGEVGSEAWHSGATLLHFAVKYNQFDVARHLILRHRVDIALKDADNFTAFDRAVENLRRYTSGAQNYPDQFEEDRKTAEKMVDLFQSGEEEHEEYMKQLSDAFANRLYEHSQAEMIEKEKKEFEKARQYLISLGLL
jgi:ankyrin repeat protein